MTRVSSPCAYIVAFHQRDTVKTISCAEYGIAMDVYNSIFRQWAKIVFNTQNQEVLARYGDIRWTKQCEEEVRQLTTFDDTAPLQIAPYIVAFHQQDCVRMIGLYTSESSRALYDVVSNDWAKVVFDRENSQVLTSYGSNYCVKLCKDKILQLDAFNGNVPLQHASYVVALHHSDRVRMIGFSKEGPARTVYNAISDHWSKILMSMDRRRSQDLLSHGGAHYIKQCKEDVLQLSLLEDPISPSPSGTFIVASHQNDCVRMIGFSIEGSARIVYGAMWWARILFDTRRSEVLVSDGSSEYTKQCEEEVRGLSALQSTAPLQTASYIVAFHQNDRVRMLGFSEQRAACAVFAAVSDEWAKVLMNRRHSEPLASSGSTYYVRQCEVEVLRYQC